MTEKKRFSTFSDVLNTLQQTEGIASNIIMLQLFMDFFKIKVYVKLVFILVNMFFNNFKCYDIYITKNINLTSLLIKIKITYFLPCRDVTDMIACQYILLFTVHVNKVVFFNSDKSYPFILRLSWKMFSKKKKKIQKTDRYLFPKKLGKGEKLY